MWLSMSSNVRRTRSCIIRGAVIILTVIFLGCEDWYLPALKHIIYHAVYLWHATRLTYRVLLSQSTIYDLVWLAFLFTLRNNKKVKGVSYFACYNICMLLSFFFFFLFHSENKFENRINKIKYKTKCRVPTLSLELKIYL